MSQPSALIRQEAIAEAQFARFARPTLRIRTPYIASMVTTLIVIAGTLYLALTTSYRERIAARGFLVPESGILRITSGRAGEIGEVFAAVGSDVQSGEALLRIESASWLDAGRPHGRAVAELLDERRRELAAQREYTNTKLLAEQKGLERRIAGLRAERTLIGEQVNAQQRWLALAAERLRRHRAAQAHGAISIADLLAIEAEIATGDVQLRTLQRARLTIVNEIATTVQQLEALTATRAAEQAAFGGAVLDLESAVLDNAHSESELLVAPVASRIVSISQAIGSNVLPGQTLAVLAPSGEALVAELFVPLTALGLVTPGQVVTIRYDAYPIEEFGVFDARIERIDEFAFDVRDSAVPLAIEQPVFRVVAALEGGRVPPLQAGMSLRAHIELRELSVVRWLAEPILRLGSGAIGR